MNYSAKISTKNPMAIAIMVDQSGSMSELMSWNGVQLAKSATVGEHINNILAEFVARSRSESGYRHYYDIMVIGYSGDGVHSLLADGSDYFLTPEQLMGSVKRTQNVQRQRTLPDGRIVMTNVAQRVWVDVAAQGRTPMREAFVKVTQELKGWCAKHPDSFPPLIVNITDGEATDASAEQLIHSVSQLKSLSTNDGGALVMNIHVSSSSDSPVLFPTSKEELPDDRHAHLLHDMSSLLPAPFCREIAAYHDHEKPLNYCGMAFNASMADLVRFLNIGSTTINNIAAL